MDIKLLDHTQRLGAEGQFNQLIARYDSERQVVWMMMSAEPRPSFNSVLLAEILRLARLVRETALPVRFWVTGSCTPGMFNAGGDLDLFARSIRSGDRETLRAYARACVDCIDEAMHGFGTGAISIALVDGHALGGGYECALAHHFVLAEEQVRLGFPEIRFNLFPGMGAYPLTAVRAGRRTTERLIGWGEQHPVGWHEEQGLVDRIAPAGGGYAAVLEFMDEIGPRFNGVAAMLRTRLRSLPISREVLMATTEDWAESAFGVGATGVDYMERLVAVQDQRFAGHG
ncbi:crotonase/enoyl-CoA hydratase family protein [Kitasatospora sp. NPDC001683]